MTLIFHFFLHSPFSSSQHSLSSPKTRGSSFLRVLKVPVALVHMARGRRVLPSRGVPGLETMAGRPRSFWTRRIVRTDSEQSAAIMSSTIPEMGFEGRTSGCVKTGWERTRGRVMPGDARLLSDTVMKLYSHPDPRHLFRLISSARKPHIPASQMRGAIYGLLSREQEGSRRAANCYRAAEFSKTLRATAQNG